MCDRGHQPDDHNCRKNHEGSSKSMEPASAVRMICENQMFEDNGVRVDTMVGDEDAATKSHVGQAADHTITKWSDKNHTVKKFKNKLYKFRPKHTFLSADVINYLTTSFGIIIEQNKNDAEGVRHGFRNLVDHTFGRHDKCSPAWCKKIEQPDEKFKYLPDGKPFFVQIGKKTSKL